MYERRSEPLLPRRRFVRRLALHGLGGAGIVAASLVLGTFGYHWIAGLRWIDSLLNASMLLGGMGPVGDLPTDSGKLFASGFALYAGLVLIATTTVLLVPVLHRILHSIHLEDTDVDQGEEG